jgi:transposase
MAYYSKEDKAKEGDSMPKYLTARRPQEATEERQVGKLAHSVHAPADWVLHAKMVVRSWEGQRVREIAQALSCHPQTVRDRLQAFNERGLEGLGMKPGSGRKPRLSEQERSVILALVKMPPPGKPTYELTGELAAPDPDAESEWTLDTLTAAARERGIRVARSQVRRIFRREGVRWRRTRLWATSKDPDFVPKGPPSSHSTRIRLQARRSSASTNLAL